MSAPTTNEALAALLSHSAYTAYKLTLGSVPPWMSAVGQRMRNPVVGDLVMEISTYYGRGSYPADMRIGTLVRTAREAVDMEWDAADGPQPTEPVFYIIGLDGVEHRWTNASFIAIPNGDWERQVEPDEESVRAFQSGTGRA